MSHPSQSPTLDRRFLLGGLAGAAGISAFAAMTKGGPLNSTMTVSYYTYNQFGYGNYGFAAAMSYLIFVVIAIVTAVQFRLLRERT